MRAQFGNVILALHKCSGIELEVCNVSVPLGATHRKR